MSNKKSTPMVYCDGSLALAVSGYPQFRVIEGGRSAKPRRAVRAQTTVKREAARFRQQALTACVIALMLALACMWVLQDRAHAARVEEAFAQTSYQTATVMPGTTLWGLAEAHPVEGCSTSEVADHIRTLNQLDDASLSVGMQLQVPAQQGI